MESEDTVVEGYDYRLDGEPRAVYHWEYRKRYREIAAVLQPNREISPIDEVKLGIIYALIANNQLNWNTFDLRGRDREEIGGVTFSGKSCHIDFADSHVVNPLFIDMNMVCDAVFGRECRRNDHLYLANPEELRRVGVRPFWLPLPNQPLHVRLVHESQIKDPSLRDVGRKEKETIAGVWRKIL